MSETRYDWLADRWVIFAPKRRLRPDEYAASMPVEPLGSENCPFCAGNEAATPTEVFSLPARRRRKRPWLVRVVPNKYPALQRLKNVPGLPLALDALEDDDDEVSSSTYEASVTDDSILFCRRQISGAHEVIIETPEHKSSISELEDEHVCLVFEAFRQRLNYWRAHNALHYAVIFKNVGYDAGASLVHTHSQLITANFVPPDVLRSCQRMQLYRETYSRGYFGDLIDNELANGDRIITTTKNFAVVSPFASHLPYTVLILPKVATARFEEINDKMLDEFALLTRQVIRSLETILPGTAYNFVLHTSPFHDYWDTVFHWRMELFPRLTRVAGFEWGSDCFINPILPEDAALQLRQVIEKLQVV